MSFSFRLWDAWCTQVISWVEIFITTSLDVLPYTQSLPLIVYAVLIIYTLISNTNTHYSKIVNIFQSKSEAVYDSFFRRHHWHISLCSFDKNTDMNSNVVWRRLWGGLFVYKVGRGSEVRDWAVQRTSGRGCSLWWCVATTLWTSLSGGDELYNCCWTGVRPQPLHSQKSAVCQGQSHFTLSTTTQVEACIDFQKFSFSRSTLNAVIICSLPCNAMKSWVEFISTHNISGASQWNGIAAFSRANEQAWVF